MKQSLEIKLGQRLTITPQLQQAIRLLQLSAIDLRTEIQQALEENPLLEETDGASESDTVPEDANTEGPRDADTDTGFADADVALNRDTPLNDGAENAEWEDQFEPMHTNQTRSSPESAGYEIDSRNSSPPTLKEHLRWQMQMTPFSDTDREIAITIIDSINDDGYLTCSIEDVASTVNRSGREVELDEVEATLHQIHNFEPIGVGARNLKECLLIQLRQFDERIAEVRCAREIVSAHFELLGNRDYAQLRKKLDLDEALLHAALKIVQNLHPRPGGAIAPAQPNYIVPDIIVKKVKGQWRAELNPETFAYLKISDAYNNATRRGQGNEEKRYIQDQLQEARWFIKSLRNRNQTLLEVARAIIERQQDFLEHGEQAMKPMVLHHIAAKLDMHESTISRATTQKYMLTPRGVFELKYFFSSHVSTSDGGTFSSTAIRSLIKKFIDAEPPAKPISDKQIAKLLDDRGIKVARRTVAKYREHLNIPPSNQRKCITF